MESKTNSEKVAVEAVENAPVAIKKPAKSKPKAQREKSSHPPTSEMVTAAIKELKDRKGSSLQAIKKYITSTYKVDAEKFAPFIKRYLKSAIASGAVVQTKGKGASGSFKLSSGKSSEDSKTKKPTPPAKKGPPKKPRSVEKKTVPKKAAAVKKQAAVKKAVTEKKAAPKKGAAKPSAAKRKTATEAKSMSKAKKTAKAPAAKTKTPKPKKAAASKLGRTAKK